MFPVWGEYDGPRGYSLGGASVEIGEQEEGPHVPVLLATNRGDRPALLLEGQLLEGGWQSRSLVRSVLVPAHAGLELEVVCVEQGRWGGQRSHRAGGRRGSVRMRSASAGVAQPDRQGEVWRRVAEYNARVGADETGAFTGHLDRAEPELRRLTRRLRPLAGQCGVIIGLAGQPAMVEVFDHPLTLRREFNSIMRAAGIDALGLDPVPTPARRARRLVERATRLRLQDVTAAGAGRTVRAEDQYSTVSGLRWGGRMVHATVTNVRHPLHQAVSI